MPADSAPGRLVSVSLVVDCILAPLPVDQTSALTPARSSAVAPLMKVTVTVTVGTSGFCVGTMALSTGTSTETATTDGAARRQQGGQKRDQGRRRRSGHPRISSSIPAFNFRASPDNPCATTPASRPTGYGVDS